MRGPKHILSFFFSSFFYMKTQSWRVWQPIFMAHLNLWRCIICGSITPHTHTHRIDAVSPANFYIYQRYICDGIYFTFSFQSAHIHIHRFHRSATPSRTSTYRWRRQHARKSNRCVCEMRFSSEKSISIYIYDVFNAFRMSVKVVILFNKNV